MEDEIEPATNRMWHSQ